MRDRLAIVVLGLIVFVSGATALIISPILPDLARSLGVKTPTAGLLVTAYSVATASSALVFGPVSDRFARKRMLLAGLVALAIGNLSCGLASDLTSMLGARIVAGVGAGVLVASTTAFVADRFDRARRGVVMGWVMSGFFFALVAGVPAGAALTERVGWRAMFGLLAALVAVVLIATASLSSPPRSRRDRRALRGALGDYLRLAARPRVAGLLIMSLAVGTSMTMFMVYVSPWMETELGLDTSARGLVYAVGGPALIVGGPLAGRIADRIGRAKVVVIATLALGLGQLSMPLAAPWLGSGSVAIFFFVVLAGCCRSAPFQTLAIEVVEPEQRGTLSALRNAFTQAGGGLGAAVGGAIWSHGADFVALCCLASTLTVIGVVAFVLLVATRSAVTAPGAAD